ncbi:MAG: TIM barrel protein [Thermoplasmata archaeon]
MIRFGPSGIPLSCKGRTQRDGIEDIHALGLNAMEIQFVRVNLSERHVTEEEVGLSPEEIENEFVVGVYREGYDNEIILVDEPNIKLQKGDLLRTLNSGIAKDAYELRELGELAMDLDVALSLHGPYYMDLLGEEDIAKKSMEYLKYGGLLGKYLNASIITTHMGLYHSKDEQECLKMMIAKMREIKKWYDKMGISTKIGLETSGKQKVFGSLEEIIEVCKAVPGIVPVVNFAHLHARTYGSLRKKEDFQNVIDILNRELGITDFYFNFSGVDEGGNEKRYTPIKRGDIKFEVLAETLLDNDYSFTIISSSPLLEHDAMYMKIILERVQLKRELKTQKLGVTKSKKTESLSEEELAEISAMEDKIPVRGSEGEPSVFELDSDVVDIKGVSFENPESAEREVIGKEELMQDEIAEIRKESERIKEKILVKAGLRKKTLPAKEVEESRIAGKSSLPVKGKEIASADSGKKNVKAVEKKVEKKGEKKIPKITPKVKESSAKSDKMPPAVKSKEKKEKTDKVLMKTKKEIIPDKKEKKDESKMKVDKLKTKSEEKREKALERKGKVDELKGKAKVEMKKGLEKKKDNMKDKIKEKDKKKEAENKIEIIPKTKPDVPKIVKAPAAKATAEKTVKTEKTGKRKEKEIKAVEPKAKGSEKDKKPKVGKGKEDVLNEKARVEKKKVENKKK